MKVLISAIACNPYLGSECYFGWAAVKCLAQDHEVWVIAWSRDQPDIERARKEGLVPAGVRFAYAGAHRPWHPNRLLARLQNWKEYFYFAKDSLRVAQKLHREQKFDVVQHVTYSTWRVSSPMWRLGIPFVYGPICGNERFPFRLFTTLSVTGAAFELMRKVAGLISWYSPGVRRSIREAAHIFAITTEARQLTRALRGSEAGISTLSPGMYSAARVAEFARFVPGKPTDGVLRLYAAGNLGGQKCIALALRALVLVKQRGVDFRYHLGANGPEVAHLKKLVNRLKLNREVIFGGPMSRDDYQRELGNTHIYLLPSMRETVGLTMLEAMLAGCVPIVADEGGPRFAVTEACGYKIRVSTAESMAKEMAGIIEAIDRDRSIIAVKGAHASQRIAAEYSEDHYRTTVNEVYRSIVKRA